MARAACLARSAQAPRPTRGAGRAPQAWRPESTDAGSGPCWIRSMESESSETRSKFAKSQVPTIRPRRSRHLHVKRDHRRVQRWRTSRTGSWIGHGAAGLRCRRPAPRCRPTTPLPRCAVAARQPASPRPKFSSCLAWPLSARLFQNDPQAANPAGRSVGGSKTLSSDCREDQPLSRSFCGNIARRASSSISDLNA